MKKVTTLLVVLGIAAGVSAQSVATHVRTSKFDKNSNYVSERNAPVAAPRATKTHKSVPARKGNVEGSTVIGITTYDLQTNRTMPRRLLRYPDGTMSAIFTYSQTPSATTNNDRGTGYVYFDGTTWSDPPSARLENNGKQPTNAAWRCGFASIAVNAAGKEIVTGHNGLPTPGGDIRTIVSTHSAKGVADWKTTFPVPNNSTAGGLNGTWHKTASSGDNIYVITTIDGADLTAKVAGGIYFSKSTDGGVTFSNFALLPGVDTNNYPDGMGSADAHTIDAFDKYVVISGAGRFSDLAIWKSEDFGATFTRTVVQKFPIAGGWESKGFPFSDIDSNGIADTIPATDCSPDVILDKNGKAHLFWGQVLYYQPNLDSNAGSPLMLHPDAANKQIFYWNENDKTIKPIAGAPDLDANGIVNAPANGAPFSYAFMGYAGQPTTGIDAAGNLYLAYVAYVEGDTTTIDFSDEPGLCYYNLFATKSTDGGLTWKTPVNLTNNVSEDVTENIFPSMARYVDDNIHLIWQVDAQPGSAIQTQGTPENNDIHYMKWNSVDFTATGVRNTVLNDVNVSIFPNPSKGNATITVAAANATNGTISVKDMMGRTVKQIAVTVNAGSTMISEDLSSLSNGVYLVNFVTEKGSTEAQKLVISK